MFSVLKNANFRIGQPLLFASLIFAQLSLCLILFSIVQSKWFGYYFDMRLRETLLDSYRQSSKKNPHLLEQALAYSCFAGRFCPDDMDLLEDLALLCLNDDKNKRLTDKAIARLESISCSSKLSAHAREIAMRKLLRLNLAQCKVFLRKGQIKEAAARLALASNLLCSLPGKLGISKLTQVQEFLDCSKLVAAARNDTDAVQEFQCKLDALSDPLAARDLYKELGLSGFDEDFSADYISVYLLTRSQKAANPVLKIKAIGKALFSCRRDGVQDSTRFAVYLQALQIPASLEADKLKAEVLKDLCSGNLSSVSRSDESARLLIAVLPLCAQVRDPQTSLRLFQLILDAAQAKTLKPSELNFFLSDFYSQCSMASLLSPGSDFSALEKLSDKALEIAEQMKLDSTQIMFVKIDALRAQAKLSQARDHYLAAFQKSGSKLSRVQERWAQVEAILLANALSAAAKPEQACLLLEKLLSGRTWSLSAYAQLLLCKAECHRASCLNRDQPYKNSLIAELETLRQKGPQLSREDSFDADEYLLRAYLWNRQFANAEALYKVLKSKYGTNSAEHAELCMRQLLWLRALPSYDSQLYKQAVSGLFPEQLFADALPAARAAFPADSIRMAALLLWLAEHEFCRSNAAEAAELCKQVLSISSMKNNPANLSARVLLNELSGLPDDLQGSLLECAPGTRGELDCLVSIFHTSKHYAAEEIAKKIKTRIKEHEPGK